MGKSQEDRPDIRKTDPHLKVFFTEAYWCTVSMNLALVMNETELLFFHLLINEWNMLLYPVNKTKNGWFYQTTEQVFRKTYISDTRQRTIIKSLKNKGFLDTKWMSAKNGTLRHFKINTEAVALAYEKERNKLFSSETFHKDKHAKGGGRKKGDNKPAAKKCEAHYDYNYDPDPDV